MVESVYRQRAYQTLTLWPLYGPLYGLGKAQNGLRHEHCGGPNDLATESRALMTQKGR
jgi:hypothetical protein